MNKCEMYEKYMEVIKQLAIDLINRDITVDFMPFNGIRVYNSGLVLGEVTEIMIFGDYEEGDEELPDGWSSYTISKNNEEIFETENAYIGLVKFYELVLDLIGTYARGLDLTL